MDSLIELLIQHGYLGMLISAFVAGSVLPFSSEAVMLGLLAAGLDPWQLIIWGTIGNVAGGMFNYVVASFGRLDWIEKYLGVKKEKLDRAERFMAGRGALMSFFAFIPVIGSGITVVLGLMRANVTITIIGMTLGKFLRFVLLVFGAKIFI